MMCTCRTLSISIGPMGLSFVSHTNNVSFLYWINSIRSHHTQRSTRGSSRELLSRFTRNPCRHLLAWSMLSFPLYQLTPEFRGDSYTQGGNNWAQVQSIYYSAHKAVAPSGPLCLAEVLINHFLAPNRFLPFVQFGGGFLLSWGAVSPRGGTGYEKFCKPIFVVLLASVRCNECSRQPYQCNIWRVMSNCNWPLIDQNSIRGRLLQGELVSQTSIFPFQTNIP